MNRQRHCLEFTLDRIMVRVRHIEQRISGMVGGNIGFSISDMRAHRPQAVSVSGWLEAERANHR